jgi:hypothetical protein
VRAVPFWTRVGVAVTAGLLVVACGDDKESSAPPTTVVPTTSTTLSQIQLDKQKAGHIVLTAADLPGFTANPTSKDEDPEAAAVLYACANNDPLFVRLGSATDPRGDMSPDFSTPAGITIGSGVTFGDTEDEARTTVADVSVATFPSCITKATTTAFRKDPRFETVNVTTSRLPTLKIGDQSIGYRSIVRLGAKGNTVTVYLDETFVRSGRAVAFLNDSTPGTALPEAERTRLLTVLAGRMAAP